MNVMKIRKATLADIPQMMEIFAIARRFMAETGNPNQWAKDYPSVEQLTDDIESGDSRNSWPYVNSHSSNMRMLVGWERMSWIAYR